MSNKILKILLPLVIGLIVLAIVGKQMGWVGAEHKTKVAVEKISRQSITEKVSTNGKIYPSKEVKLSVEVSGEVTRIEIKEGDSVKKGDLLLVINPNTYQSAVSRAKATYQQALSNFSTAKARNSTAKAQYIIAEKDYLRQKQLFENKIIAAVEFESVESRYYTALGEKEAASQSVQAAHHNVESAKASFTETQEMLQKTKLYAPMSGIVSKLNVAQGEKVVGTAQMVGTELITIANLNQMELQVDVGENDVLRISIGDTAEIEVDAYSEQKFMGVVSHIAYSSNKTIGQQTTKFQVKIKLLASSYKHLVNAAKGHAYPFRPGLSATADILTNRKNDIVCVPIQSVTTREDKDGKNKRQVVYLSTENNLAREIEVQTGIQDDEYIEILSEITLGANVIAAPFRAISKELEDSMAINIVLEDELFQQD